MQKCQQSDKLLLQGGNAAHHDGTAWPRSTAALRWPSRRLTVLGAYGFPPSLNSPDVLVLLEILERQLRLSQCDALRPLLLRQLAEQRDDERPALRKHLEVDLQASAVRRARGEGRRVLGSRNEQTKGASRTRSQRRACVVSAGDARQARVAARRRTTALRRHSQRLTALGAYASQRPAPKPHLLAKRHALAIDAIGHGHAALHLRHLEARHLRHWALVAAVALHRV